MYSIRMRENADQNNSEYEHFSRSDCIIGDIFWKVFWYLKVEKSELKIRMYHYTKNEVFH